MTIEKLGFDAARLNASKTSVAELSKRLKDLHSQLKSLGQENTDLGSLTPVKSQLISPQLLQHKDKGVRLLAACCISDVLRICAPDVIYSDAELHRFFDLFVEQLQHLADPRGPYYPSAFYVIENVSTVKSIALLAQVDNSEPVYLEIFLLLFKALSNDSPPNLLTCCIDILSQIIDEAPHLNHETIDFFLMQVHSDSRKKHPVRYSVAKQVVVRAKDRLQNYVTQYFAENASSTTAEDLDIIQIKKSHELAVQLYYICEPVLLSVIPQLEVECKCEQLDVRMCATQALGEMFCARRSTVHKQYLNAWLSWVARSRDKDAVIRGLWLDYVGRLLQENREHAAEIFEALSQRLMDGEEKIRRQTIDVLEKIVDTGDVELLESFPVDLLKTLSSRAIDKKSEVRVRAICVLGKIYNAVYKDMITASTTNLFQKFGWIPQELVAAMVVGENDVICEVERVLEASIFAYGNDDLDNCRRFLCVFSGLDAAFFLNAVLFQQSCFAEFVTLLKDLKGNLKPSSNSERSKDFSKLSSQLSLGLVDSSKAIASLKKLAERNNQDIYAKLSAFLAAEMTSEQYNTQKESLLKMVERGVDAEAKKTVEVLLRKATHPHMHAGMLPFLIQVCRGAIKDGTVNAVLEQSARNFLKLSAALRPSFYFSQVGHLVTAAMEENGAAAEESLNVLSKICVKDASVVKVDELVLDFLEDSLKVRDGKSLKYAANILILTKKSDAGYLSDLVDRAWLLIRSKDEASTCRGLTVLTQIARHSPASITTETHSLVEKFIKDDLMPNHTLRRSKSEDVDAEWVEDADVSTQFKAISAGLVYLTKRFEFQLKSEQQNPNTILPILFRILKRNGELTSIETNHVYRSRMRCVAALCIVSLSRSFQIQSLIGTDNFQLLSEIVQDPCANVREIFLVKLMKYLRNLHLHIRFFASLLLVPFEPEAELLAKVRLFTLKMFKNMRKRGSNGALPETLFPRLIHLCAHHSDFCADKDSFDTVKWFLAYYFDLILSQENASLLYHIAMRVKYHKDKAVKDPTAGDKSAYIYMISDLAQSMIRERCSAHGWALPSYEGKFELPSALFSPFEPDEEPLLSKVLRTNFYQVEKKKKPRAHENDDHTFAKPEPVERKRSKTAKQH